MGQAKRRATKFRPKAVGGGIMDRSLAVLREVVPDNPVKLGDPRATNWWNSGIFGRFFRTSIKADRK